MLRRFEDGAGDELQGVANVADEGVGDRFDVAPGGGGGVEGLEGDDLGGVHLSKGAGAIRRGFGLMHETERESFGVGCIPW